MDDPVSQALADCIESIQSGQSTIDECLEKYPQYAQELKPVLEVMLGLQAAGTLTPRQLFQLHARERLLSKISSRPEKTSIFDRLQAIITGYSSNTLGRPVWAYALVILMVLVFLGTGTVYAASRALPGDLLYPVKLDVENVALTVASGDDEVRLHILYTENRRHEIKQLVDQTAVPGLAPGGQRILKIPSTTPSKILPS